jgi:hypothetical protein
MVDQAWGIAQVMVAGHDNHAGYYGVDETTGHPGDKYGWAVGAAVGLKNLWTGPGDVFNIQGVYTDGASRYNFQSLMPTQPGAIYGGSGIPGVYQGLAIAGLGDVVYTNGSSLESVKTWGFRGGFTHNWNPYWASGVYGAYAQARFGNAGKAAICANFVTLGLVTAATGPFGCNPDFNFAAVGVNTIWTPIKNLAFTADVTWAEIDQKYSGNILAPVAVAVAKPGVLYQLKNESSVSALLRVQRNF